MTTRTSIQTLPSLLLPLLLLGLSMASAEVRAEAVTEAGSDAGATAASAPAGPASAEDAGGRVDAGPDGGPDAGSDVGFELGFDPAAVGLRGFDASAIGSEDFAALLALIDRRIADIEADQQAAETTSEPAAEAAPVTAPAVDPRLGLLRELRAAVQRESMLMVRIQEIDARVREVETALEALRAGGESAIAADLGAEPPYSLPFFDHLRAKRDIAELARNDAVRLRTQAERRLEAAEQDLENAVRARRQARDQLAAASDAAERPSLERALELARLTVLVALQRREAAEGGLALARREQALAAGQLARLEAGAEYVATDVFFSPAVRDELLAELQAREDELRAQIEARVAAGDAAELALFSARRQREQAADSEAESLAEARLLAREAELAAARRGADYLHQAATLANAVRTLLERRFAVFQGETPEHWSAWLRDTSALIERLTEEVAFAQAELDGLRAKQLTLERRVARGDEVAGIERAVQDRIAALKTQEQDARELLAAMTQALSIARRLHEQLDRSVSQRTLQQRIDGLKADLDLLWQRELFVFQDHGIHTRDLVAGALVFVLVLMAVSSLRLLLRRRLLPRLAQYSDPGGRSSRALVLALIRNTHPLFVLIVAFYAAMTVSGLAQGQIRLWLGTLLVIALYIQVGLWATAALVDFVQRQRSKKEQLDPSAVTGYGLLQFFLRVGVWLVVVVSILAYFQYPVAGLIGALGVGGIAVAFAVQNILSDVFHSMAIILDKPFKVGDFVVAGDTVGVIDNIGVKTTRIRSLSGERVVMSNTNLLGSTIRNFKHMHERRVVFKVRVAYQTSADQLEMIPKMVEEIICAQPTTRFDRAHLFAFGDYSFEFEVVYYVLGADYTVYMDRQQAINLALYRQLQAQGIELAYPAQKLFLTRTDGAADPRLSSV
ncbi:mechanosensitive ion channel [Thiohalocapsa marina]|uniref:Mechanosensitive ion channel n=1 Tax=Thiohalocapsa marina TaxID=424902 RepID=A0A5M8FQY3_9GAMM|nr:mechanosensitive ion channel domain-containing protein [Thiohalocapsa marina]KAA6186660.1 mechanosensitive ion channel [Thiohalocapsa marina]